jgi:hypothetical protein
MKTFRFYVRSRRSGFAEWVVAEDNGVEVKRINRDIHAETVGEFRRRIAAQLEAEGFTAADNQYSL